MGAGASTIDVTTMKAAAKDRFDEATFDALAVDGHVGTFTLEVPAGAKAGLSFGKAGCVTKMAAGGLADRGGVCVGWRCHAVGSAAIDRSATINAELAKARETKKPFTIGFVTPPRLGAAAQPPKKGGPKEEEKEKEKKKKSGATSSNEKAPVDEDPPSAAGGAEAKVAVEAKVVAAAAAAAAAAKAEAENARRAAEAEKAVLGTGKCKIRYEMYDELFDIVAGSTKASVIDEAYCLSYVMPNCKIHLSPTAPADRTTDAANFSYVDEDPEGEYRGLETATEYWCYITEDAAEFEKYHRASKQALSALFDDTPTQSAKSEYGKEGLSESCSCVYGNPCVDEYGCKDWANRSAVATKNGWKGHF